MTYIRLHRKAGARESRIQKARIIFLLGIRKSFLDIIYESDICREILFILSGRGRAHAGLPPWVKKETGNKLLDYFLSFFFFRLYFCLIVEIECQFFRTFKNVIQSLENSAALTRVFIVVQQTLQGIFQRKLNL